ncbi:AAA family ATPase [Bradyrhizobium sp. 83012]|uniref:AAA family ATPase n=1 Tax=Bradyrhizobium aeschynomenes TaxID=2734909 RepID=A0ABX2CHF7_9BRAD|nr:AAA family ATPase [Bradyrhizobium aeschynomenes]NPU67631.1 AAA family ATPase [Bradyrhizobium aeschynomenes]
MLIEAIMTDKIQLAFDAGDVFTPGSPINALDLFAGRSDQIEAILNAISQRGYHAILYGERGVGKTSLSNVLSQLLHGRKNSKFLLPRINCDASDTYTSLWRKQFNDIIVTETRMGIGFNADQIEVSRRLVDTLPEQITPDDVRRTLEQLSKGLILVPIFDEFDRVRQNYVSTLMADTIKMLSDYSVPATIILIGVADSVDGLIGEHQSIERALIQIPMPRMSGSETGQIVTNGLTRLRMTINNEALEEIIGLSQGLPYITHLLALYSSKAAIARDSKVVESSDVDIGIKASLGQWQQSVKSAYYHATKSQQPGHIYKEVLLACAVAATDDLGYFAAADVREPLRHITGKPYDIPNFARHLKELSQPGRGEMLSRTGEKRRIRYRFESPLLRPYIIMRGFSDHLLNKDDMKVLALTAPYKKV